MSKKQRNISLAVFLGLIALLLVGIFLTKGAPKAETVTETMRDTVLHEAARISLFGITVNPALISAFCVTGILLLAALLLRIFASCR